MLSGGPAGLGYVGAGSAVVGIWMDMDMGCRWRCRRAMRDAGPVTEAVRLGKERTRVGADVAAIVEIWKEIR